MSKNHPFAIESVPETAFQVGHATPAHISRTAFAFVFAGFMATLGMGFVLVISSVVTIVIIVVVGSCARPLAGRRASSSSIVGRLKLPARTTKRQQERRSSQ